MTMNDPNFSRYADLVEAVNRMIDYFQRVTGAFGEEPDYSALTKLMTIPPLPEPHTLSPTPWTPFALAIEQTLKEAHV